jgi:hypothetical protein
VRPQPPEHPTTHASALNTRDDLRELADLYETVAALELTPEAAEAVCSAPGSRVPPGAQEILDADEIRRALAAVDEWATFLARVLVVECDVPAPDSTPARLRLAGEYAGHFVAAADSSAKVNVELAAMHDRLAALAFLDDLHRHRSAARRLAGRGVRRIPTKHRCTSSVCDGMLVSTLGEDSDAALRCDKCGTVVPFSVWSSWPRTRVTYITAEHAMHMLEAPSVQAVWQRASRGKWRKVGTGRDVRYHVDDVRGDAGVFVG